ncbi:MAG: dicarboxylate/amino acid:cation symporter [Bacillota bacterium]|nr:dicarboxylate/amino acid:cation symporter [Bacillota bacterium]MDW7729897.1 dicarboxylate/amino acid:cation symporter [Bacillota bacterium]
MKQYLEMVHPRPLTGLVGYLQGMVKGRLWLKIIIAMIAGLITGIILSPQTGLIARDTAEILGSWLAIPGNIFLGLIQMIVVPLIFASVIRGIASSDDLDQLKKIGIRLVIYFLITTSIAIVIGLSVSTIIMPGNYIDTGFAEAQIDVDELSANGGEESDTPGITGLPEVVVSLIPQNPLGSMVEREMLQVVLFAIFIGLALVAMPPKQAQPILSLMGSLQEVCMTVVRWAMYIAPLAVFGLLAQITIKVGLDALLGMAVYVGTVILGLLLMIIVYLLIVSFLARYNPLHFLSAVREVQLLAFSTSSSAAVMPLSMQTAEEKLGVRPSISQFLIPLGASINMDGTALYQAAATVFLAQVYNVELGLPALLLILVTTVGASIGSPATPGVGIVILAMVLSSVGIPASGVALIIGVDRILDMSRTAVNVTGDLTACLVMDRWVGGKRTAEEERMEEGNRNVKRACDNEDVVCDES